MTTYNGKCHCGEVQWTAKLPEANTILCHCDTCKQLGGGPYSLNQIIPTSDLKVTKGNLRDYSYKGASGKSVHCYHCPNCTSHAYHQQDAMGPDKIVVRTVLLDGGDKFKPAAEIFGKARLGWMPEVAQTFDTMPPDA